MRILGRLVLFLYGLFIAMVAVVAIIGIILVGTGQISYDTISGNVYNYLAYQWAVPALVTILLIIFVISIKLAFRGADSGYEREPIIRQAAGGEIAISLDTFESIVTSTLRKVTEAKDFTARVGKVKESITVSIDLSVLPEVNIPELGENIQAKTIEAIESMTGVKVLKVRVNIENISVGFKSKLD